MYPNEGETQPTVEQLPNELLLVNDYLPGRATVSISLEVFRGSRDEPEHQAGGHHFIEHVVWRGCKRYKTFQLIDDAVKDNSGISLAVTDHENTKFKINLPADKLLIGAEILAALVKDPLFLPMDIENVRNVILEEIDEYHDHAPAWIAHRAPIAAWGKHHPMGRPVYGSAASVSNLNKNDLVRLFENSYVGNAMAIVVSGGGRLDYETALRLFGGIPNRPLAARTVPEWSAGIGSDFDTRPGIEKAYWAAILPGITGNDPDKSAYFAATEILQERLDRTVRERDGFAYGISTSFDSFQDCGIFAIESSSRPQNVSGAIASSISEVIRLAEDGPTERELYRQKAGHHGDLLRYIETPNGLNNHWASELQLGHREFLTPLQVDSHVMAITLSDVHRQAKRLAKNLKDLRLLAVTSRDIGSSLVRAAERAIPADLNDASDLVA